MWFSENHIKRYDYVLKPLSMLALCIHWFNPLMWVSFILSQKDMEMSCDEKVISVFDDDIKIEYANLLIKIAVKQNILLNSAFLAFGESNIKGRINGVMNFKKTRFWVSSVTIFIFVVIGIVLLTNDQSNSVKKSISTNKTNDSDSSKTLEEKEKSISSITSNPNREIEEDIREIAYKQLTVSDKDKIVGSWQDAKSYKITLKEGMGIISDKSYIGKEVYLIDFQIKTKTLPNNMIVYLSIDNYKLLGYGIVD